MEPIFAHLNTNDPLHPHQTETLHTCIEQATPPIHQKTSLHKSNTAQFNLPTPIHVDRLGKYLQAYDPPLRNYLLRGFTLGFPIGSTGLSASSPPSNHPSVFTHSDFVQTKLVSEITAGRIKGPFPFPPLPNFITSPLGVVPKRSPNSFRLIHDLSYPKNGISVNSTIPTEQSYVELESFDHVASLVLKCGYNSLIAKADIEDAFRIIPISPTDYHKLGFTFKGQYYFDTVLPMGASSSVSIFESLSKALQWILHQQFSVQNVSHIIDDFIFVGTADSNDCQSSLNQFLSLAKDIGIPIKHEKTVYPSTTVTVHGILLDTATCTASLPLDKLENLRSLLETTSRRKKVTLQHLQSILGHLNFACKVIKPGRCFLRRLYDLTKGHTKPSHFIKLTKECRSDLKLWYSFLSTYNGVTLLTKDRFISSRTLKLHTDAAGSKGFACTHLSNWTYGIFPTPTKKLHINILELYPIALAVAIFGCHWENKNILFICDNLSVVHCLNKQTSKDPQMMSLIRTIVLQALQFNFCFKAKHLSTKDNYICDKLSRLQVAEALCQAPHLNKVPVAIPIQMSPWTLLK